MPDVKLTTQAVPPLVKLRWRLRFRLWLERKFWPLYKSPTQKVLEENLTMDLTHQLLYGRPMCRQCREPGCLGPEVAVNQGGCRMSSWGDL